MRPRKDVSYAVDQASSGDEWAELEETSNVAESSKSAKKRPRKTKKAKVEELSSSESEAEDVPVNSYPVDDPIDERIFDSWGMPEADLGDRALFEFLDPFDPDCPFIYVASQNLYYERNAQNIDQSRRITSEFQDVEIEAFYELKVRRPLIKSDLTYEYYNHLMFETIYKKLPFDPKGPVPSIADARKFGADDEYFLKAVQPVPPDVRVGMKKLNPKAGTNRLDHHIEYDITKKFAVVGFESLKFSSCMDLTLDQYKCQMRVNEYSGYQLKVYLNLKVFTERFRKRENVDMGCCSSLMNSVDNQIHKTRRVKRETFENLSDTSLDEPREPEYGFGLTLRDYQKRTLGWMMKIENKKDARMLRYTVGSVDDVRNRFVQLPYENAPFIDLQKSVLVGFPHLEEIPGYGSEVEKICNGFVLADDTGSGKTVTVFALIHSNPFKSVKDIPWDSETAGSLIPSRATLVVCPSHLATQWKTEAIRCMPGAKVILITTINQHQKFTWNDILFADIVIVSIAFLQNPNYKADIGRKEDLISGLPFMNRQEYGDWRTVALDKIMWHRLVYDEFHEYLVLNDKRHTHRKAHADLRENIHAKSYVGVTGKCFKMLNNGRDFSSEELIMKLASYLKTELDSKLISQFVNKMVRRNVPNLHLPQIIQHIKWVSLSAAELAIYESCRTLMSCNHFGIDREVVQAVGSSGFLTLQEVTQLIQKKRREDIEHHQKEIDRMDKKLGLILIDEKLTPLEKTIQVDQVREAIDVMTARMEDIRRQANFFDSVLHAVEQAEDLECLICLENIGVGNQLSIAPCGHIHCLTCIERVFQYGKGRCSACRNPIARDKCAKMSVKAKDEPPEEPETPEVKSPEVEDEKEKIDYNKYGSKVGALVNFILDKEKNEPESKIILFVQFHSLAILVQRVVSDAEKAGLDVYTESTTDRFKFLKNAGFKETGLVIPPKKKQKELGYPPIMTPVVLKMNK